MHKLCIEWSKMMRLALFEKSYNFRAYHIEQYVKYCRTSRVLRKSAKISLFEKNSNIFRRLEVIVYIFHQKYIVGIHMHIFCIYKLLSTYAYTRICMLYTWVHIYTYTHVYMHAHIYTYICMCTCMYTTYIHVYFSYIREEKYIHISVHTHL